MPASQSLKTNSKQNFNVMNSKSLNDQVQPVQPIGNLFPKIQASDTQQHTDTKKTNILFPEIQIVQPLVQPKKFIYRTASYIHYYSNSEAIQRDQYQLSQEYYQFYKNHHQLMNQSQNLFTQDSMKHALIFLDKNASFKAQSKLKKNWLQPFLNKIAKNQIESNNIELFQSLLFNYWKQRHIACNFPMFRPLWKKMNKQDPLYVYRPRNKKIIEKITEYNQQSIIEALMKQIEGTSTLCHKIIIKQQMKLKQINKKIKLFQEQAKKFVSLQNLNDLTLIDQVSLSKFQNIANTESKQTKQQWTCSSTYSYE